MPAKVEWQVEHLQLELYRKFPQTPTKSMQTLNDLDIIEKVNGPVVSPVVMVLQNGKGNTIVMLVCCMVSGLLEGLMG